MSIQIQRLDSGYLRAQGNGPCEWAQWPEHGYPNDSDFFPEASEKFRAELHAALAATPTPATPLDTTSKLYAKPPYFPPAWKRINGERVDAESIGKWFFQVDDKRQAECIALVEEALAQAAPAGKPEGSEGE